MIKIDSLLPPGQIASWIEYGIRLKTLALPNTLIKNKIASPKAINKDVVFGFIYDYLLGTSLPSTTLYEPVGKLRIWS